MLVSRERCARLTIQDVLSDFLTFLLPEEMTSFVESDVGLFFRREHQRPEKAVAATRDGIPIREQDQRGFAPVR